MLSLRTRSARVTLMAALAAAPFGALLAAETALAADTTAPSVSFQAPGSGATVKGLLAKAACEASASDSGGIARVQFSVDGNALNTEYNAPYNCSNSGTSSEQWDTRKYSDGSHTLSAKAYDRAGNTRTTTRTVVIANNPGAVSFEAPLVGQTVSGKLAGAACQVAGRDADGISRVSFAIDGKALNTEAGAPYNCSNSGTTSPALDTTRLPNGSHRMSAELLDKTGVTTSTAIDFKVANAAPVATPTPTPASTPTLTPTPTPADPAGATYASKLFMDSFQRTDDTSSAFRAAGWDYVAANPVGESVPGEDRMDILTGPDPFSGSRFLRVRADERDRKPYWSASPTGNPRVQLNGPDNLTLGGEYWIGFAVRFPDGYKMPTTWNQFAETHGAPYRGDVPFAMGVTPSTSWGSTPADQRGKLVVSSGFIGGDNPWKNNMWVGPPVERNKWYRMKMRYKVGRPGFVEFWLNGVKQTMNGPVASGTQRQTVTTIQDDASRLEFILNSYREAGSYTGFTEHDYGTFGIFRQESDVDKLLGD